MHHEHPSVLIGRLQQREDPMWLAELPIEIESGSDDITRLEPIGALMHELFVVVEE